MTRADWLFIAFILVGGPAIVFTLTMLEVAQ